MKKPLGHRKKFIKTSFSSFFLGGGDPHPSMRIRAADFKADPDPKHWKLPTLAACLLNANFLDWIDWLQLVAAAYSSIRVCDLALYLGLAETEAGEMATRAGWALDTQTGTDLVIYSWAPPRVSEPGYWCLATARAVTLARLQLEFFCSFIRKLKCKNWQQRKIKIGNIYTVHVIIKVNWDISERNIYNLNAFISSGADSRKKNTWSRPKKGRLRNPAGHTIKVELEF